MGTTSSGGPIHVLDIGARGNLHPRWNRIADRVRVTAFEADENAPVERASARGFDIVRCALWKDERDVEFHLTRSAGCSSVYVPNAQFLQRFDDPGRFDVLERRKVHAKPLSAFELKPNFIKLDTQGSELEILEGAGECLDSVIGIEIEVEFAPVYQGQPLFPEVDTFLRSKGFELHDLNRFYWRDLQDGQMRLIDGEALYFRRDNNEIAKALKGCYSLSLRQTLAHSYQWLSRYFRPYRIYDSDMQLGQ
jgi:FkbM family methyltransferase